MSKGWVGVVPVPPLPEAQAGSGSMEPATVAVPSLPGPMIVMS